MSVSLVPYAGTHSRKVQGLVTVYPGEGSIASAVVFPIDTPDPQSRLLSQPAFHSSEGIVADITESTTCTGVAIVVRPSPEQVIQRFNLVSDACQGCTPAGHVLDLALHLQHTFLAWIGNQIVVTPIRVDDPFDSETKKVKSIRHMGDVSFLRR